MTNWAAVVNNPSCVKDLIKSEYWFAVKKINETQERDFRLYLFVGIASGGVFIIIILIIMICIKKKYSKTHVYGLDTSKIDLEDFI